VKERKTKGVKFALKITTRKISKQLFKLRMNLNCNLKNGILVPPRGGVFFKISDEHPHWLSVDYPPSQLAPSRLPVVPNQESVSPQHRVD